MFGNIKKFVRKHKYKFIIAGISIAFVGAFLAWFVDLSFLAMTILSFIWTGYFYFLGKKDPLDKNKTNDNQNKNKLKIDLSGNKDIKLENALKFPEYQVQTQETKNLISNKKNKNMDQKVKNQVSITEELVKSYIDDVFVTKQKSDKSDIEHPNLVDTTKEDPADGVAAGPEVGRLLHRHFQKVNWWEYQLSEILSQVKQIVSILTNRKLDEICTSLSQYKNNNKLSWFVISFEYAIGKWPTDEDATHSPDYLCIGELACLIDEISASYQEKYPQIVKEPSETGHKYDNVQEAQIDSFYVPITEELVFKYLNTIKSLEYLETKKWFSGCLERLNEPLLKVLAVHFKNIKLHTYSLNQIIRDCIKIISILTGTDVSQINEYLMKYRNYNGIGNKYEVNPLLFVTEQVEKIVGRNYWHDIKCPDSYRISIDELDKLIKKIEERYLAEINSHQSEINELKKSSPKLGGTSQLSK